MAPRPVVLATLLIAGNLNACGAAPSSRPVANAPRAAASSARVSGAPVADPRGNEVAASDAIWSLPAKVRKRVKGPTRPEFTDVRRLDYADLPLLENAPLTSSDDESFWLVLLDKTSKDCAPGLPRPLFTWRFSRHWSSEAIVRIGDALIPPPPVLDGRYEDDDLYQRLVVTPAGNQAVPKHMSLVASADWVLMDHASLTPESVRLARYQGPFSDMSARATNAWKGEARAIVPGELYAFRQCTGHCDAPLGDAARTEELGLIGPPMLWDGSSGPVVHAPAQAQPFTLVTASVRSGASATLLLDVSREAAISFAGTPIDSAAAASFEIDLVWPSGEAPELQIFSGQVTGKPEEIHGPTPTSYTRTSECLGGWDPPRD